jgi:hypothetical protein
MLTLALVLRFAREGGFQLLLQRGLFGYLTLLGWGISLILGPLASVQIWRFKPIGWLASALIYVYGAIYYLYGFAFIRNPTAYRNRIILAIGYHALCATILATKSARSTCKIHPKSA